ncbi:MAG: hypothetical protein ACR2QK_18000, partial [Acidimicrobiales bacterium]
MSIVTHGVIATGAARPQSPGPDRRRGPVKRAALAKGLVAVLATLLITVSPIASAGPAADAAELDTTETIPNPDQSGAFGSVLAQSSHWLAVSAPDNGSAVHVYSRDGQSAPWQLFETLPDPAGGDEPDFGRALAFDFPDLAVSNANRVFWFNLDVSSSSSPNWELIGSVTGIIGGDEDFGAALAFDGNGVLLIGAPLATPGSNQHGVVYQAVMGDGGPEVSTDTLIDPDSNEGDRFGTTIEVTSETGQFGQEFVHAWIGAPGDDDGASEAGAVYRYTNPDTEGYFFEEKITSFGVNDQAGRVLAADPMDPKTVAVGIENANKVVVLSEAGGSASVGIADIQPLQYHRWLDMYDGTIAVGQPTAGATGGSVEIHQFDANDGTVLGGGPIHSFTPTDTVDGDLVGAAVLLDPVFNGELNVVTGAPGFGGGTGQVYSAFVTEPEPPIDLPTGLEVDGGWAAVGEPETDSIHIGHYENGAWVNTQTIVGLQGSGFGTAVALDGPVLAIGAPVEGKVYVHVRSADGVYSQIGSATGPPEAEMLGSAVDVKGRLVVATAPEGSESLDAGSAVAVTVDPDYSGLGTVSQIQTGNPNDQYFGTDVAIVGGTRIWISAATFGDPSSGRVGLFELVSPGSWEENGAYELFPPSSPADGLFGTSLDADGAKLIVGQPGLEGDGRAWIYTQLGSSPEGLADSEDQSPRFGVDVAISGDIVAVGNDGGDGGIAGMTIFSGLGFGTELEQVARIDLGPGEGHRVSADGPYQLASILPADGSVDSFTEGTDRQAVLTEGTSQAQKLHSVLGSESHLFGGDLAVEGDRMAVLSPEALEATSRGAVEIFSAGDGLWNVDQVLVPDDNPSDPQAFTDAVALAPDGTLAVLGDGEVYTFAPSGPGGAYAPIGSASVPGGHAMAMSDDWLAVATDYEVMVFATGGGDLSEVPASPTGGAALVTDVAIDGDLLAVATFDGDNQSGEPGAIDVLNLPDLSFYAGVTGSGENYGDNIGLAGDQLVASGDGEVTIYTVNSDQTATLDQVLSDGIPGSSFGFNLAVDQNRLVVARRANTEGDGPTSGLVYFGYDGSTWAETGSFDQPDQVQNLLPSGREDDGFGDGLALSGPVAMTGAPLEDEAGIDAGAVFATVVPDPPDIPMASDITVTVATSATSVAAGASAVATANLPPQASDSNSGGGRGIADTSLGAVAAEDGESNPLLTGTTVADLGLNTGLLDGILLSDVPIDGGWGPILAGTPFENRPIQGISLGEVIAAGLIDNVSLDRLDLSATPVGAVPVGAVAIADTPVGAVPLPNGQTICPLAEEIMATIDPTFICLNSYSLIDLGIRGVPVGAVPVGAVPVGAVAVEGSPVGAVPVGVVDLAASPVGAVPVGAVDIGSPPVGAVPAGAVPVRAVSVGAVDL